ncbi:MAG TPA: hypothetical protein VI814_12830 [Candidatus Limnocylindria bacterium]
MVKIYGKAGLFFGLMTAFARLLMTASGAHAPSTESRVIEGAERDAQRMVEKGYRVVSSEWYEMPLGLGYQKVIYELADRAHTTP